MKKILLLCALSVSSLCLASDGCVSVSPDRATYTVGGSKLSNNGWKTAMKNNFEKDFNENYQEKEVERDNTRR